MKIQKRSSRKQGSKETRSHRAIHPAISKSNQVMLLRKIAIGSASDPLEQEADRVADQVMQFPAGPASSPRVGSDTNTVRRTLESPFSLEEGRMADDEGTVQTKRNASNKSTLANGASPKIHSALQQSGTTLPPSTRIFMEQRFQRDFNDVRLHTGNSAHEAAQSINARAFTLGKDIAFAKGQFSPNTKQGNWLLAHELAHVVQQGTAPEQSDASSKNAQPKLNIGNEHNSSTLRRVKWGGARDTGQDVYPWRGLSFKGDVYEVETDAGTKIEAWKPHDGSTYWCHGFTFGGSSASNGPFSIWGSSVKRVLQDDGYQRMHSCVAEKNDVLVFEKSNVTHSGKVLSAFEPNGIIDENRSTLDSKWGSGSQNQQSWAVNAGKYGRYGVYSKTPASGPCAGKGANEL